MNALTALRNIISGFANPAQETVKTTPQQPARKSWYPGNALYGGWDLNTAYRYRDLPNTPYGVATAVTASVEAFGCIQVRSSKVGSMPWQITRRSDGEVIAKSTDIEPRHPLGRAIQDARRQLGGSLFGYWEYWLCIHGEAYLEPTRNPIGFTTGLTILDPLYMQVVAPLNIITGYRYSGVGGSVQFDSHEIVYHKYKHPYDPIRGLSPMEVALQWANIDRALSTEILSYFRKSMRPSVIVSPKNDARWDENDEAFLGDMVGDKMAGAGNAHGVLLAPAAADIVPFAYPKLDDQDTVNERLSIKIHEAYRTPRSMTGNGDASRYQANNTEDEWFFDNVTWPECTDISEVVQLQLMPYYDRSDEYEFQFDRSEFSFITEADKARADIAQIIYQSSIATRNEAREKVGLEPVPGGDVFITPVLPAPAPTIPAMQSALPESTAEKAPLIATDATKDGDMSLFVALDLANDPALLELQSRLKQLYPNPACEWNDPADFHITLLYAPNVDQETAAVYCEALADMTLPPLDLRIGSLHTFDNVGEHALHFRIRRNTALLEFQAALFELAQELGIPTSQYSVPVDYTPHVTMGYLPANVSAITYRNKTRVRPTCFFVNRGDTELYRSDAESPELPTTGKAIIEGHVTPKRPSQANALEELEAWHKAAKKDVFKAFAVSHIPTDVATCIRAGLADCEPKSAAVKSLFSKWQTVLNARQGVASGSDDLPEPTQHYIDCLKSFGFDDATIETAAREHLLGVLSIKALTQTRARFEAELERQFMSAFNEKIKRGAFISRMMTMLTRYSRLAYADGYEDAGSEIDLNDLDDDETEAANKWLNGFIDDQEQYVRNIADVLYADDQITADEIKGQKPTLWWTGSVLPAYNHSLVEASKNARLKWKRNPAKESCRSCIALDGIVLTAKRWKSEGVEPGSRELECWGGLCGCGFETTKEKKYRGSLPQWRFKKSVEIEHEHVH